MMLLCVRVAAAGFLLILSAGYGSAQNISVDGRYLTDQSGHNYGVHYSISSTVAAVTCVYPHVITAQNVHGSVTQGPVILQPNESGVSIGEFIQADQSQPWATDVGAKWREQSQGGC